MTAPNDNDLDAGLAGGRPDQPRSLPEACESGAITNDEPSPETPPPAPVTAAVDEPIAPVATAPGDAPVPVRDLEPPRAPVQEAAPPEPRPLPAPPAAEVRRAATPPAPVAAPQRSRQAEGGNAAPAADGDELAPSFEDLGLSGALLRSIRDVGYEEPTPIQLRTIPVLLAGRDVIAQAQTGSGKTAAYGLPIIEVIDPRNRRAQALVLCPTRELAIQVAEALHKYGRHKEVETLPIYGGQPYERQFRGLQRGVHIVVGTPGRVMDHMRRGTLNLDSIRFFVLDEADEMLDMGFIEDIEWILEHAPVPSERQSALFSATMPPRIVDLAQRYLRDPERITIAGKQMTVPETHQTAYEIPRARKIDALTRILDAETPPLAMIFCRTKLGVDELGEALMARGYGVETLHGDLSQAQRDRVMRRFRSGQADILIATDVAARGLDIPDVSHVINYDVPESAEAYVHRIGRTGRAGRAGAAITLVTPRETRWLRQIERIIRARIEFRRLPTAADVAERRREAMKEQVREVLGADTFDTYRDVVGDLAEEYDALDVAAAILKLYADETGRGTPPELQEDDVATFAAAGTGRGETGMTRLVLNVGRNQGVRPQDVVGAIANEARIPGRSIGAIDILDTYTFVDIPQELVDCVLQALQTATMKGRPVHAEIATAQPGPGRPERGGGGFARDRFDANRGRDGGRDGRGSDRRWDRPREGFRSGPRRDVRVGGVRLDRDGSDRDRNDTPRPPAPDPSVGPGRRFDRTGPARFRVRREDGEGVRRGGSR